jgi:CXXX repeat modification system protein
MIKEKVGEVTTEEMEEIRQLHERKIALHELVPSLNSGLISKEKSDELYEKIISDIGQTSTKSQNWWNNMGLKYQWKSLPNGNWSIDFSTNEIFLVVD